MEIKLSGCNFNSIMIFFLQIIKSTNSSHIFHPFVHTAETLIITKIISWFHNCSGDMILYSNFVKKSELSWTLRLAPHQHEWKFSGARVCKVTFLKFPHFPVKIGLFWGVGGVPEIFLKLESYF